MESTAEKAKRLREKIAIRLSKLRKDSGLTQAEMAEDIGFTQNIIFRSEHDGNISTLTLLTFFLYYSEKKNLNPMWLFSPDNDKHDRYITPEEMKKLNRDSMDSKRRQIMDEMIKGLKSAGLVKE